MLLVRLASNDQLSYTKREHVNHFLCCRCDLRVHNYEIFSDNYEIYEGKSATVINKHMVFILQTQFFVEIKFQGVKDRSQETLSTLPSWFNSHRSLCSQFQCLIRQTWENGYVFCPSTHDNLTVGGWEMNYLNVQLLHECDLSRFRERDSCLISTTCL